MSAKVEESIKDIQERVRREKRDQELQESLAKAEAYNKEMEARLAAERQTWVETLKTQIGQKDSQEKEVEYQFELRMKELERRWHEEKLAWSQAIKAKDEEVIRLHREKESAVGEERAASEKRVTELTRERESLQRELIDVRDVRQEERSSLLEKLEGRDKEFMGLKAQQAMLVTQVREAKDKQDQMRQLLEKFRAEKENLHSLLENKDKEFYLFKTQFALYQTRSKSEQEKLLKELVLFKDQMGKDAQQYSSVLRAKEEEMNLLRRANEGRESEIRNQLEKKEQEVASTAAQYEARIKTREAELRYELERKETELKGQIVHIEEQVRARVGEIENLKERHTEQLRARDGDIKSAAEKLAAMQVEVAVARQNTQSAEQRMALAQSEAARLKEIIEEKEVDAASAQAQFTARLEQAASEVRQATEREQALRLELAVARQNMQVFETRIAAAQSEVAGLKEVIARKDAEASERQSEFSSRLEQAASQLRSVQEREQTLKVELASAAAVRHDLEKAVEREHEEAERQKAQIVENENLYRNGLSQKDTVISAKELELAGMRETIAALRMELVKNESMQRELTVANDRLDVALSQANAALSDRDMRLARAGDREKGLADTINEHVNELSAVRASLAAVENEAAALRGAITERDGRIKEGDRKEDELRAQLLSKEGEINTLRETMQQREAMLVTVQTQAERRENDMKIAFAQRDAELNNRCAALEATLVEKDRFLAGSAEKERALSNALAKEEEKVSEQLEHVRELVSRENELKMSLNQKENAYAAERAAIESRIAERDRQLTQQAQAFEAERRKYEEAVSRAERSLQEASAAAQLQLASREKEIERLNSAVAAAQHAVNAAKQENALHEQELQLGAKQREAALLIDITNAREKAKKAEQVLSDSQRQHQHLLLSQEQNAMQREAALSAEKNAAKELLAGLKADNDTLRREGEKMLAEVNASQHRMNEVKELYERQLRAKEEDLAQIKANRLAFEDSVRHQINEEYRRHLEGVQREKQDGERAFMNQIQTLRDTMRTDLLHVQETMTRDHSQLERQLQEKEARLHELQQALKDEALREQEQKTALDKNVERVREEYKALLAEETRKHEMERDVIARNTKHIDDECSSLRQRAEGLAFQLKQANDTLQGKNKEVMTLQENLDTLTIQNRKQAQYSSNDAAAKTAKFGPEDTVILEPHVPQPQIQQPAPAKQRKPLIGRIWDNLNEPVIEIGGDNMKKKDHE